MTFILLFLSFKFPLIKVKVELLEKKVRNAGHSGRNCSIHKVSSYSLGAKRQECLAYLREREARVTDLNYLDDLI